MTLRNNEARCPGVGYPDEDTGEMGWREGCENCARRLSPVQAGRVVNIIEPPPIIAFWCEWHIPMKQDA